MNRYIVNYIMETNKGQEKMIMYVNAKNEREARELVEKQVSKRPYVIYCKAKKAIISI